MPLPTLVDATRVAALKQFYAENYELNKAKDPVIELANIKRDLDAFHAQGETFQDHVKGNLYCPLVHQRLRVVAMQRHRTEAEATLQEELEVLQQESWKMHVRIQEFKLNYTIDVRVLAPIASTHGPERSLTIWQEHPEVLAQLPDIDQAHIDAGKLLSLSHWRAVINMKMDKPKETKPAVSEELLAKLADLDEADIAADHLFSLAHWRASIAMGMGNAELVVFVDSESEGDESRPGSACIDPALCSLIMDTVRGDHPL